jgi:hypothetical protein
MAPTASIVDDRPELVTAAETFEDNSQEETSVQNDPQECEEIPAHAEGDDYIEDDADALLFPNRYRVDIVQSEPMRERQKEDELRTVGNLTLVADMDSLVYISTNFEHLIDAAGHENATFIFSNLINRCKPNTRSRFKLRHIDMPNPSFFGRRARTSDYKSEWYANIQLAQVTLNGMRGFLTLGILDVTSLRSTNYFTTVQAAVLASAFTYARSRWSKMPEIIRLFNMDYSKVQKFNHSVEGLPKQFETKINATGEVNGRVESMKQVASSEGRVFLRAVFGALRLFATDTATIIEDGRCVHTADYHGCENLALTPEEFQKTAQTIIKSGFLTFQAVGIKNLFFNHPEIVVEAHEKESISSFYSEAVDLYRKVVKFWLRSNTIANSESSIPLDIPRSNPWVALEDPAELSLGLEDIISTGMNTGGLKIPRDTQDVCVYFDVGLSVRANDVNSALIINASEASWTMNQIESLDRLTPGRVSTVPANLGEVFDGEINLPADFKLPEIDDLEQKERFAKFARRVYSGESIQDSSLAELQDILNDFANDSITTERGDHIEEVAAINSAVDSSIDFTAIQRAIRHGEANIYPQAMTNGEIGNVHTGNSLLEIHNPQPARGTEFEKWQLVSPIRSNMPPTSQERDDFVESLLRGGQFYCPNWRNILSKQTRDYDKELPKFPAYLMAILRDDDLSKLYDQAEMRAKAQKLWKAITYIHRNLFRECYMKTEVRMELFFEYKDNVSCRTEGLDQICNLLASVRQCNHDQLATYMKAQSNESCNAIDKLLSSDSLTKGVLD